MTTTVEPTLLARALENELERSRRAARALKGSLIEEGDGLLLIAAPDMPWITGAHVTRVQTDAPTALARIRAFFDRHAPAHWDVTAAGEVAAAIRPALEAEGFVQVERRPGMVLAPLAGREPPVAGLEIREVRDTAGLADFVATSGAGFEGGAELFARLYTPESLDRLDGALYVGYLDGEPVATALRTTSHRIAGIGGVSTVAAARRRGIGAALTWRAALDGLAEGCIASYLGASEMGYSMYAGMGYRHVVDFHVWRPPA
jgi:hypothetical protein